MKNNSLIEYKEGLVSKIRRFFSALFKKNKKEELDETITDFNKAENDFFDNIKVDSSSANKVVDKKKFLEYIDGNVKALKMLSVDRLRKLKEYYDDVIEENDKIIENLKKSS